jgi:hypothetical protein
MATKVNNDIIQKYRGINRYKGWNIVKEEKNMNIVDTLVDAVIASGKKLSEIPKESIYGYLSKAGISKSSWEETYKTLENRINERNKPLDVIPSSSKKDTKFSKLEKVDLKQRVPRKNIFSEIKKLT